MKISRRVYKERQQPEERKKLGQLEKRKDALNRLKTLRKNEKKHKKLQIQARKKTGKEYFFKMNSCVNDDGEIIPIAKPETKYDRLKIRYEMNQIEKKLAKMLPNFQSNIINLETGELIKKDHLQKNDRKKYEEKLKNLQNLLN